jgi:hypothetical protein
MGVTTLTLHPIPAVLSQPMLYVELCRAGVGYLVDFLHITPGCEAVVNFESPSAASQAAQVLQGLSILGSPGLAVGVSKIQGCGANIVHYATQGVETDPKRAQFTQSFEYPVPHMQQRQQAQQMQEIQHGQQMQQMQQMQQLQQLQQMQQMQQMQVPPEMCEDGPRLAPNLTGIPGAFSHALSAVDMNVEGSLQMRSPKTASRFASLGISLELAESDVPEYSATPEFTATPEYDHSVPLPGAHRTSWPPQSRTPPERSPPCSATSGSDPSVTKAMRRAMDMERALHAGFPDMLSSPACVHLPGVASRGSSSDSRDRSGVRSSTPPSSTPVEGSTGASTPPAPPCSPHRGRKGLPPRVPA